MDRECRDNVGDVLRFLVKMRSKQADKNEITDAASEELLNFARKGNH
jgi:hypothetical protein